MNLSIFITGLFIGFIFGVLFAVKVIDKPEVENNFDIENIRTRGRNNTVDVQPDVSFMPEPEKPKFKLQIFKHLFNRPKKGINTDQL